MTSITTAPSTADAHKYGVLFVFAAGVLWSTVGLGIRLIEDAVVWQILLYRSISMSLFLYVLIRVRSGESPFVQIRRIGAPAVIAGLSLVAAYSGGNLRDPEHLGRKCHASVCDSTVYGCGARMDSAARTCPRRNLDSDRRRNRRDRDHGRRQVRRRRPERQPCRAWFGIRFCSLHRGVAMGADRGNAASGVPLGHFRDRHHFGHMLGPRALLRAEPQ